MSVALIRVAPRITWLLVRTLPSELITIPVPAPIEPWYVLLASMLTTALFTFAAIAAAFVGPPVPVAPPPEPPPKLPEPPKDGEGEGVGAGAGAAVFVEVQSSCPIKAPAAEARRTTSTIPAPIAASQPRPGRFDAGSMVGSVLMSW